ncbi:MAG: glycosyltransferase family 2 protein [Bdellovibrionales bacterium]
MKLSVVICTKNEEKNIGRCLAAVQSVADEIIIVDSMSTDRTEEIARSFPRVQFVKRPWKGFSQTKNEANELATGDYVLSLDADEELSSELQQELKALKPNFHGVYTINRMTNYCGQWIRYSGWFPDRHLRLFPKGRAAWEGHFVHEKLKAPPELVVSHLQGLVFHYSYYTMEEHRQRIESYSSLGAQELISRRKRIHKLSLWINPLARFLKCYVFKFGFLDGYFGLVIAVLSAKAVYLKYSKAYRARNA